MSTQCLACQNTISAKENVLLGEVVGCPGCGQDFEVVKVDPFQIGEMPQVEEDWGE